MPSHPTVLFVGNFVDPHRGSPPVSLAVSRYLRQRGWRVLLASSERSRVRRLWSMLATAWTRRAEYDAAVIDVFSGRAFYFAESVASLLYALRKPFALALHGGRLPEFAARHPHRVRRLLTRAPAVIAPSPFLQESLRAYRADIRLIPNPVTIDDAHFRARGCLRPNLVWLRAYHQTYNLPLALAAVDELRKACPAVRLSVIGPDKGDGTYAAAVDEVARRGLQAHVRLLGPIPKHDIPARLDEFDIFLNTTNVDNTPVSVLEAMAAGLCVVSTNVGGIPFLLEHETDALLIPPGDVPALVQSVLRLLDDEALAARLSANAHAKATLSGWGCVLPAYEQLLTGLRAEVRL